MNEYLMLIVLSLILIAVWYKIVKLILEDSHGKYILLLFLGMLLSGYCLSKFTSKITVFESNVLAMCCLFAYRLFNEYLGNNKELSSKQVDNSRIFYASNRETFIVSSLVSLWGSALLEYQDPVDSYIAVSSLVLLFQAGFVSFYKEKCILEEKKGYEYIVPIWIYIICMILFLYYINFDKSEEAKYYLMILLIPLLYDCVSMMDYFLSPDKYLEDKKVSNEEILYYDIFFLVMSLLTVAFFRIF